VITLIIILIVTIASILHFHFKCSVMTAFSTFMASIFGSIIAFTYYEMLADLFISRGYGIWAPAGCFVLAFVLGFAAVRALADLLVGANIDFGNTAKMTVNLILGTITGLILSGHLLVAMGMMPIAGNRIYNRFPTDSSISLNNPNRPILNPDGMVTSLFCLFSRGSLSSANSFGVLCSDFVNRNHLNRYGIPKDITIICSKKALWVPKGTQKPVRTMEMKDLGTLTVIRAVISAKDISDGGAKSDKGVVFTMSQVRAIAKPREKADNLRGVGEVFPPIGILDKGKLVQKTPSDTMTFSNADFRKDSRTVWVDFVFDIPAGKQAVLLEFKQNAITALPPPVPSTEDIEAALNTAEGV
jgi:hypothetical protein